MAVHLPTLPRDTNRETQIAFDRLRDHANQLEDLVRGLTERQQQIEAMPSPLSLAEIQKQLSAGGTNPLNLTGLIGTSQAVTAVSGSIPPPAPLPPLAPNMTTTLQTTYATRIWIFDQGDAYDREQPDGRGAFIRQATVDLHNADPRWGYIFKQPPQNCYIFSSAGPYNAVDAIIFNDDDGVTAEIYDVISGSGTLVWNFIDRTVANRALWVYPL